MASKDENPQLIACPACGQHVAKSALSCPHCGQPSPFKEKERQESRPLWEQAPIIGRDVVVASECHIQNGEVYSLKFSGRMPLENEGLTHISSLTSLRHLLLHSAQITDEGLEHLTGLKNLTSLDLVGCSITPNGLAQLADIGNLTSVSLDGAQATEIGLQHVQLLPHLEHLTISSQHVSGTTMNLLAGFPSLKYVHLDRTSTSAAGMRRLKQARPDLKILERGTREELP